jgi:hypothetical protein
MYKGYMNLSHPTPPSPLTRRADKFFARIETGGWEGVTHSTLTKRFAAHYPSTSRQEALAYLVAIGAVRTELFKPPRGPCHTRYFVVTTDPD